MTTLDANVQTLARNVMEAHLEGLAAHNVRDGAALVVDNATGDVLAYVGSAGPASRARHVDGVRAHRQAGSTLKPFLYGLALERRYVTNASLLDDSPVSLDTATGVYLPQNYDRDFKGLVSVRTALGSSLNIPAVRTLVLVGVEAFRDRLHSLGYRGHHAGRRVLWLFARARLGGSEPVGTGERLSNAGARRCRFAAASARRRPHCSRHRV